MTYFCRNSILSKMPLLLAGVVGLLVVGCNEGKEDAARAPVIERVGQASGPGGSSGEEEPGEPIAWEIPDLPFSPETVPPPLVPQPLHECAEEVFVKSCLDDAMVEILDDNGNIIGPATRCVHSVAAVALNRPLRDTDEIQARQ